MAELKNTLGNDVKALQAKLDNQLLAQVKNIVCVLRVRVYMYTTLSLSSMPEYSKELIFCSQLQGLSKSSGVTLPKVSNSKAAGAGAPKRLSAGVMHAPSLMFGVMVPALALRFSSV